MKLIKPCLRCGKPLIELSSFDLSESERMVSYKCGHSAIETIVTVDESTLDFTSIDGSKKARKYQEDGVEFIIRSNFNCVLADQMRLGKTPQVLIALKNKINERTPTLIVVKSANVWQWVREYRTWTSTLPLGVFVIEGSKSYIVPGFSAYVISMDTLSRGNRVEELLAFGFKLVIVDEAHSFKNTDSNRSQALIRFLKEISVKEIERVIMLNCTLCHHSWKETTKVTLNLRAAERKATSRHQTICPQCGAHTIIVTQKEELDLRDNGCGCVMLTGTPIKNRADEYFVPLNIVAPEKFPSLKSFQRNWLMKDEKGKYSRVASWYYDAFKKLISPYVLRREKEDVYKDLPIINRMFSVITIDDEKIKQTYNAALDRLELKMSLEGRKLNMFNSLGELNLLRQITGYAKCDWAADYIEASLLDINKIAIGFHHHSVRDKLLMNLAQFGVCKIDGEDSPYQKDYIAHKYFETAPEKCLLLSMGAAKEGLELVYLDRAIALERAWSSADEEQFEYRFYNPDKGYLESRGLNPDKTTEIEYLVAKGTIDEFFYDLVEQKRSIFGETISTQWSLESDPDSFRNLLERTVSSRL